MEFQKKKERKKERNIKFKTERKAMSFSCATACSFLISMTRMKSQEERSIKHLDKQILQIIIKQSHTFEIAVSKVFKLYDNEISSAE